MILKDSSPFSHKTTQRISKDLSLFSHKTIQRISKELTLFSHTTIRQILKDSSLSSHKNIQRILKDFCLFDHKTLMICWWTLKGLCSLNHSKDLEGFKSPQSQNNEDIEGFQPQNHKKCFFKCGTETYRATLGSLSIICNSWLTSYWAKVPHCDFLRCCGYRWCRITLIAMNTRGRLTAWRVTPREAGFMECICCSRSNDTK